MLEGASASHSTCCAVLDLLSSGSQHSRGLLRMHVCCLSVWGGLPCRSTSTLFLSSPPPLLPRPQTLHHPLRLRHRCLHPSLWKGAHSVLLLLLETALPAILSHQGGCLGSWGLPYPLPLPSNLWLPPLAADIYTTFTVGVATFYTVTASNMCVKKVHVHMYMYAIPVCMYVETSIVYIYIALAFFHTFLGEEYLPFWRELADTMEDFLFNQT